MARRRSAVADFFEGFNQGYSTVGKVLQDRELRRIATEAPQTSQGFTADQGAELEAAAQSGQYDINFDQAKQAYTITPKADPTQTGTIAMQGVTDFMGNRTAGQMSESQVANARQRAMAGVLMKSDPITGMRMMREVTQGERDDQRFAWEKSRNERQAKQWDREDQKLAEQDEYEQGRKGVFSNSRFGQNQSQYQQQMQQYQQQMTQFEADKAAGKQVGQAPVMPARPEYSLGDALADRAALIDHDAKYGKLDARAFGEFTDMLNKVQNEGYERALRLAQSGAPIQEIAKAFNATGQTKLDPASIVSDKVVAGKDGVQTRVIQFRDGQGNVRTINALAELDALGKASDVFTRHFQGRQDARAERADARAGTQFAQGQNDRTQTKADAEARANAAVNLFKERNPNATQAELDAVRRGILEAVPTTDKNSPAEVKLAKAMVDAGLAPDMRSALEMAITKKSQSAKEAYLDLMKPSGGIQPREEDVAVVMETAFGANWREKVGGAAGGRSAAGKVQDAPKVNSPAELAKLPKGARYTAPDGSIRIKQ